MRYPSMCSLLQRLVIGWGWGGGHLFVQRWDQCNYFYFHGIVNSSHAEIYSLECRNFSLSKVNV